MTVLLPKKKPENVECPKNCSERQQDGELRRIEENRERFLHDYNSDLHEAETKGKAETLLRHLSKRFGEVSKETQSRIVMITEVDRLDQLIDAVLDCPGLKDFEANLD